MSKRLFFQNSGIHLYGKTPVAVGSVGNLLEVITAENGEIISGKTS